MKCKTVRSSMSDVEESKSHSMVGRELDIPVIELTIGGVASTAFLASV